MALFVAGLIFLISTTMVFGINHNLNLDSRIVGGSQAQKNQFPWLVSINACDSKGCSLCGGSLISPQYVLTAAHCTSLKKHFEIGLGSNSLEKPLIKVNATKKIEHDWFNSLGFGNDIALLKLAEPIEVSDEIQPVKLAKQDLNVFDGTTGIAIGFGRTDYSNTSPSNSLNYLELKVISNSECSRTYPRYVTPNILCAKGRYDPTQDLCVGDSGGPLVLKQNDGSFVQIGVVSFSSSFCDGSKPVAFTRITAYIDWIEKNLENKL